VGVFQECAHRWLTRRPEKKKKKKKRGWSEVKKTCDIDFGLSSAAAIFSPTHFPRFSTLHGRYCSGVRQAERCFASRMCSHPTCPTNGSSQLYSLFMYFRKQPWVLILWPQKGPQQKFNVKYCAHMRSQSIKYVAESCMAAL
jgi:hypothetical protein